MLAFAILLCCYRCPKVYWNIFNSWTTEKVTWSFVSVPKLIRELNGTKIKPDTKRVKNFLEKSCVATTKKLKKLKLLQRVAVIAAVVVAAVEADVVVVAAVAAVAVVATVVVAAAVA